MIIYTKAHKSISEFRQFLDRVQQHEPLLFELEIAKLSQALISYHAEVFPWHAKDTVRSFTDVSSRKLSKFEFSYADRMTKYFGMNQYQESCFDYSKIICTWDPKVDLFHSPKPCFLILKFRKSGNELDAFVVFRNRDVLKRLIPNWAMITQLMTTAAIDKKLKLGKLYDFSLNAFYKESDYQNWVS